VFFAVYFGSLGAMVHGMMSVTMGGVGVMGRLFVIPTPMMLGRLMVVLGGVLVMLGCFAVMFRCFLGHGSLLRG
jgi:hypothetical protein